MAAELELRAVVPDPVALRAALAEAGIVATGLPRAAFSAVRPAALAVADLDGEAPGWDTA